ncbi:Alanine/arginine aminopeptidase [Penicillium macrosclerotiorum]|uniref:Alanine/arginine aminopeptidase n=1 Tax=Penicillium macrosclerotiorum TaxID=303699 RepID=UPI0025484062|nr:Alanine/arginine aminopeptidase [Penicillium macrosclerotiorum]KAJ5698266.1 Alanine/arginine aminopeptidase [Penicillium macrosclerotiorum]
MWGRRSIAASRRAGVAIQTGRHPVALRPSPSFAFSSATSSSSSPYSRLRPRLPIPPRLDFGFIPIRYCSAEARMMASSDRDTLPDVAKPTNYHVSLFDLQLGGSWEYKGVVKVDATVTRTTKEIVLNSKEIEVQSAEALKKDGTSLAKATEITYDKQSERVTVKFPLDIQPADIVTPPVGEPAADTPKEGDFYYMLSTQFESCDARRAFPCFDEPNLKATFDFEIEIPRGQTALSNMPVQSERDGSNPGLKFVTFEKTPVMSTYLLAWAIGDFEYVEAMTERKYQGKSIPVRVYTTRGLKDQARFALECAHRTVDYFSEIFEIEYPLPKADLLAVHEFAMGAMENWGLVTYRTTAVLFDEGKSDNRYKNRIAYVVAHELAHQWFGNLVTMDWWNELWLNEGFATWVGWLAVDHFYPGESPSRTRSKGRISNLEVMQIGTSGHSLSYEIPEAEGVQQAFHLDSLRASHPIEVPVRNALEVDQIFDHISYLKGSSVIRMLSVHLGRETFLKGVAAYLKAHAYGNATTNDLWSALSKASGQDVHGFMDPWIRKIGFPVVTVAEEPGQISVRQNRFLSTGDAKPEEDETTWWIPLGIKSGQNLATVDTRALTEKSDIVGGVGEDGFYKINKDLAGFYRTNYPPARLEKLGQSLNLLSTEDKIGLLGDAAALAVSGEGNTPALLALLEGFKGEQNYLVWSQVSSSLANLRSVFSQNESLAEGLKKFTRSLAGPAVEKIGWEFQPNEEYLNVQLRKLLIAMAGNAGQESIIAEAKRRFDLWASGQDPSAVHTNLRSAIFSLNVSEGGPREFNAVKKEYLRTDSVDGKEICLAAMGRTKEPALVQEYLDFVFSDKVAIQDMHSGAVALAANSKMRHLLWEYMKTNWVSVEARLSSNNVVFERFIRMGLSKFADHAIGNDIAEFFKNKETGAYARALVIVSDNIRTSASYQERDQALALEWLQTHGYA